MSELFQWSDEFSVGLQEVDEQHKALVGMLNELHEAIHQHKGSDASRDILWRLAEYTRIHFTVEESLMRLLNYPEFEGHKQQHESLMTQVADLQQKLTTGQAKITFELLHFLKAWLTHHISENDKQFGAYAISRGLESNWSKDVEKTMTKKRWSWKFW
ncbi:MAG TPA: bacteriohemerythrin [Rhodocyclaceae bacterium]|nr:bacteriohemerythrin [Rhodocyclaceae bacterium]HNH36186.1 bacteriohemerythrin [Rhodocyclaceae bacterium]